MKQPPNLEIICSLFAGKGVRVEDISHSRILKDTRLQYTGYIKWNEISVQGAEKGSPQSGKGQMKTWGAVWERGRKHVVIGAAETVVLYQGSGHLKQKRISKLQLAVPRQVGSKHNSVPCLIQAGQPSSKEAKGAMGSQGERITSC